RVLRPSRVRGPAPQARLRESGPDVDGGRDFDGDAAAPIAASIKRDAGRRAGVFASFRRELLEPREEREIPLPGPPLFGLGVVGRPPLLEGPVVAVPRGDGVGRRGDQIRRQRRRAGVDQDRKSTRLNSSHVKISYAVFCLKKKI